MSLGIEDPIVKTNVMWLAKDEIKVLERLCHPETLFQQRVSIKFTWDMNRK